VSLQYFSKISYAYIDTTSQFDDGRVMEEQKMCEAAAKAAATEERKHAVAVNAER
jgi:hypothetical protein